MSALLIVLLVLALLCGAAGFAVKVLWWVAVALFIAWLIGLAGGRRQV